MTSNCCQYGWRLGALRFFCSRDSRFYPVFSGIGSEETLNCSFEGVLSSASNGVEVAFEYRIYVIVSAIESIDAVKG